MFRTRKRTVSVLLIALGTLATSGALCQPLEAGPKLLVAPLFQMKRPQVRVQNLSRFAAGPKLQAAPRFQLQRPQAHVLNLRQLQAKLQAAPRFQLKRPQVRVHNLRQLQPDLAAWSIAVDEAHDRVVGMIKNVGQVRSGHGHVARLFAVYPNNQVVTIAVKSLPSVFPQQWEAVAGNHRQSPNTTVKYVLEIDPDANPHNNYATRSHRTGFLAPDLAVRFLTARTNPNQVGAVVRNNSNTAYMGGRTLALSVIRKLTNGKIVEIALATFTIPPIAANSEATTKFWTAAGSKDAITKYAKKYRARISAGDKNPANDVDTDDAAFLFIDYIEDF